MASQDAGAPVARFLSLLSRSTEVRVIASGRQPLPHRATQAPVETDPLDERIRAVVNRLLAHRAVPVGHARAVDTANTEEG